MKKFWFYTIFKKCLLFENFRLRRPQPDNREQREGGNDEACIAILNNFYSVSIIQKNTIFLSDLGPKLLQSFLPIFPSYQDGIKWHDVECTHKKPIICEEIPELLQFIENNN